jgi:putative nucleotidyltransferase with HDIG domain
MSSPATRVLVVDDNQQFAQVVSDALIERGLHVVVTDDPDRAQAAVAQGCDVAVLDLNMPRMSGLELAGLLKRRDPDLQVMILTGFGDMQSAIQGLQQGIFDFIGKADIDLRRLEHKVREAAERTRLTRTNRDLVARLTDSNARLTALQEASTALSSEQHQDRVLESLAGAAKTLLGAATGRAVLLSHGHSGEVVVAAAAGDGAKTLVGARTRQGEGIAAAVVASGRAASGPDLAGHPAYSRRADEMPTLLPGFVVAPLRHGTVQGALVVAGREAPFAADDERLLTALALQGGIALDNAGSQERLTNFFTHASDMLITVLEQLDVWYRGHSRAVAALADMVTRRLGMPDDQRRDVHYGALLHDIGKVMVAGDVLRSPRRSTPEEMEAVRKHSTLGMEILKPILLWREVLPMVHAHHEWWDGRGYPLGLAGEQIPLGARVIAVADAFDAMTRTTPHRSPKTAEQALNELEAGAGTQFDPRIVRLFVAEYRQHGHALPAEPV